jgi:hypothetical protein
MNNTEICLNCTHSYSKCPFNYYHQRFCVAEDCQTASKKYSDKKYYEKKKLDNANDSNHNPFGPSKTRGDIAELEIKVAELESEVIKLSDIAKMCHGSIYDLLSITLGLMMNLSSDDPNTISPEIIGSRCKKFYLLTQDVLKRPDLMLTTIWDCINNVQKTNPPGATSENTS